MRQKQHGKKVQNWHRPIGRRQLGRWYMRHRHDPLGDDGEWAECEPHEDEAAADLGWYPDWNPEPPPDEGAVLRFVELKQLLRDVAHRLPPLVPLEAEIDGALQSAQATVEPGRAENAATLETRLATFFGNICHGPNTPGTRRQISDAIGDDVYHDIVQSAGRLGNGHELARNVALFAPFWIRSPRTWTGGKTALVDHLFVHFEVPRFLYPEWSGHPSPATWKWLCWFILLAQGGSLKRASKLFGWNILGRFEHHLRQAPADFSTAHACVFGEVMRLGGTPADCQRILGNPAYVIDPTDAAADATLAAFWEATACWLIAHGTRLSEAHCERILAWAMHEHTEAIRSERSPFSWRDRGLRAVLEQSLAYDRELTRPWASYSWAPHGWNWEPGDATLEGWSFVELTTGEQLFREGEAMRHCVAGYARHCADGHSAIVSMRFREQRRITVEILPATGRLAQAHGVCNRQASHDELAVIHRWLDEVVRRPSRTGCLS